MTCACRKGATCPEHLAEADLTLPVPFATRLVDARLSQEEATLLERYVAAGHDRDQTLTDIIEAREATR